MEQSELYCKDCNAPLDLSQLEESECCMCHYCETIWDIDPDGTMFRADIEEDSLYITD
ncbi:hypothetical protein [Bacillus sp. FJAT-27264]|uniref:hypothetical protein n=1 Tax=Paenibacillus sp. (strain DSM 101736 / FJAT-27264) TaxID=1850362 RepID=UPI00158625E2|nr:hypothetical protein [Bacillus sp. FJAT-27264]